MCEYCKKLDYEILRDIRNCEVPDSVMVSDCWKNICKIAFRNMRRLPDGAWKALCTARGKALWRR